MFGGVYTMLLKLFLFTFLLLHGANCAFGDDSIAITSSDAAPWSYQRQDKWPEACQGNLQSPIALKDWSSIYKTFPKIKFSNYSVPFEASVTNTGHSVDVKPVDSSQILSITGGALQNEYYIFNAFHFHWGAEHTLNGYRYPLEAHFVHYAKKYGNFENASNYADGLAVLGIFYNLNGKKNKAIDNVVNGLLNIKRMLNQPISLKKYITLSDFLPQNCLDFFTYKGSLTTPGCNEAVIWTVFSKAATVSMAQLNRFKTLQDDRGELLTTNYRELQDINERTVYTNDLIPIKKPQNV